MIYLEGDWLYEIIFQSNRKFPYPDATLVYTQNCPFIQFVFVLCNCILNIMVDVVRAPILQAEDDHAGQIFTACSEQVTKIQIVC